MFKNILAVFILSGMIITTAATQAETVKQYQSFGSVIWSK